MRANDGLSRVSADPLGGDGYGYCPAADPIGEIVIVNDFAAAQGGATAVALLETRELRQRGYKVTFISGGHPSAELDRLGVAQVALGMASLLEQPVLRAMAQGVHNASAARMISQWIARHDTPHTVYHLHNWSQILSPAVFAALRPVEQRLVVTCHDFFNLCPNGGLTHYNTSRPCTARPLSVQCLASQCDRRNPAQKYWRTLRQLRLNASAGFRDSQATFTFLHDRMQARFVEGGFAADDLVTVPNPVEAWTEYRIEAEANQGFLFVGRVGRDKGADLAIRAARVSGQKLTIVGTGEIDQSLHQGDCDVHFAGWRDRAEIAVLARQARALIVPSRVVEPFGLVLLEAAMSGLPVIVSSHAYLASEASELGFAQAFDIDRDDALPGLLARFARDDTLVARMSRAGFEHAGGLCHSPPSWAEQLIRIFRAKLPVVDREIGATPVKDRS